MSPPYYLTYEYIEDISDTITNLQSKDLSLNNDINEFGDFDPIYLDPDISQQFDNTKEANSDYFIENKKQHSAWLKNMSNKLEFLYDLSENQNIMQTIVNGEYELNGNKLDTIEQENAYQEKMNQVYTYYEKKRKYQIELFKHISFVLLFLIILSMGFHAKLVPSTPFIFLIGIGIAYIVIYLGRATLDMMFSDNIDFDVYTYPHSYTNMDSRDILNSSLPLHAQKSKSS